MLITELHFLWPAFLFMLAGIPVLLILYLWSQRRRRKFTIRYSSLSLIRPALSKQPGRRRHIPPALFLLALSSLVVALARPTAALDNPNRRATIILTLDVSSSMMADDIAPNRLQAAKSAALAFIKHQKTNTQIGIVIFSDDAQLVLEPTTDQYQLSTTISSLTTGINTAMGSGLFTALKAIPDDGAGVNSKAPGSQQKARRPGEYAPQVVILLTDGISTIGPSPLDAALAAADRGIRVYTIGFGTRENHMAQKDQMGNQYSQIPRTGDPGHLIGVDELLLKKIAAVTSGRYYASDSANELENVFASLSTILVNKVEPQELSVGFTAFGTLLTCTAVMLSALWRPLP